VETRDSKIVISRIKDFKTKERIVVDI